MRTRTDRYQLADTAVWRVGYGAMRLAGPGVFGPTTDATKVLRQRFGTCLLRRHLQHEPAEAPRMYRRRRRALTALMPILLEAK